MSNLIKKKNLCSSFYDKIKESYNLLDNNLRQSILLVLSSIFMYRLLVILKIINDNIFYLGSTYIYFFRQKFWFLGYSLIIILIEFFRKSSEKYGILNAIFYKMIVGKQRILNWFLYTFFVIIYLSKYHFFRNFLTDGNIDILNTIQTLIVTFFVALNFSEGYLLYKEEQTWIKYKAQIIDLYLIFFKSLTFALSDVQKVYTLTKDGLYEFNKLKDLNKDFYKYTHSILEKNIETEPTLSEKMYFCSHYIQLLEKYISLYEDFNNALPNSLVLDYSKIKDYYKGLSSCKVEIESIASLVNTIEYALDEKILFNEMLRKFNRITNNNYDKNNKTFYGDKFYSSIYIDYEIELLKSIISFKLH